MKEIDFGEKPNYIETHGIDDGKEYISLDFKKLSKDAKRVAEKINSFDRYYFQDKIIEVVKSFNSFLVQNQELLLQNPEEANAIIEKLGQNINSAILKYMPEIDSMGLGERLDEIVNSENKETQDLIEGIKFQARQQAKNMKQIIDVDPIQQAINEHNKRVEIAQNGLSGYFNDFFK